MSKRMQVRAFLIFCAVGLVPIALGCGAKPSVSLDALFGITDDSTNLTHMMRAVMGLYLGMVVFWILGAFRESVAGPALAGCAVFMLGLEAWATGRHPLAGAGTSPPWPDPGKESPVAGAPVRIRGDVRPGVTSPRRRAGGPWS